MDNKSMLVLGIILMVAGFVFVTIISWAAQTTKMPAANLVQPVGYIIGSLGTLLVVSGFLIRGYRKDLRSKSR
jgi:hypothetical protein